MTGQRKKGGCLATVAIIIAVLAVLTVVLEYVVTDRTQRVAADRIGAELRTEQTPEVSIDMHPNLVKFVMGRIDSVEIDARDFTLPDGLTIDRATVSMKNISFEPWTLIKTKQLTAVRGLDSGQAVIVVSEKAVNDLVASRLPGATVRLESSRFRYIGDLEYLVPGVQLEIVGTVQVLPDNTIRLVPDPGQIDALPAPQEVKDYLAGALSVDYRLEDIPEGIELTKVVLRPGRMVITADILDLDFLIMGVDR